MQRSSSTYIGLDIGSSKVACIVGVMEPDAPVPSVIGLGKAPHPGVRKGVVVDIDETVNAITLAIEEAERVSGYAIERATISVGGGHIKSLNSKGVIAVGGMQHTITAEDIGRVEDAATVIQLPPNREILQVFAQQFRLDGQDNIKDPIGMGGVRLEVDAHIVTAATPALKNLQRSVYQAGLTINRQVLVSLAAARAVLDKRQRENGTVLIDIGAGTTSLAIFEEGEVLHTAVLPIGSGHITNDLAIGLRTDLDTAEAVKIKDVNVDSSHAKGGLSVKDTQGNLVPFDKGEIKHIAVARLDELFDLVNRELDRVKRAGKLPGGAVLSGGGAKLQGLGERARTALRLPSSIGVPTGFSGITDTVTDPSYAVAVGLMLEDLYHQAGPSNRVMLSRGAQSAWQRLKQLGQHLKP